MGKKTYSELELSNMSFLDEIPMTSEIKRKGLTKSCLLTVLGFVVFFAPIPVGDESIVIFGWVFNALMAFVGIYGLWAATAIIAGNALLSIAGKYFAKEGSWLKNLYGGDTIFHIISYFLASFYMIVFMCDKQFASFTGPAFIVSPDVGGTIIDGFIPSFLWVAPLCAFVLPLLLNYGGIDFIGTMIEPIMRKLYDVPGKSAVDALSSFFASGTIAVLVTNSLYRNKIYTEKEAVIITTGFSACSVGFAAVVLDAVDLGHDFTKIYFVCLFLAFIICAICCRIPPISRKRSIYVDGTPQDKSKKKPEYTDGKSLFTRATERAAKKAYYANAYGSYAKVNVREALYVTPKILTFATAAGVSCLILAEYTPIFAWIGMIFQPLLMLCGVEAPALASAALPTGLAEMYLPVLMIRSSVPELGEGVRFFVAAVSMLQMIFFSETASVQLGLKMPIKLWELVVIFFQRTFVAIPLVALAMHILY